MTVLTRYPTTSSQNGVWTLTPSSGSTLHAILADSSDATYISTLQRALTDSQFAVFDIADLLVADVPVGYKIKSVTLKARVYQVALAAGLSFLADAIRIYGEVVELIDAPGNAALGDLVSDVFRWVFYFLWPYPPSGTPAAWQDITIRTWLERPAGGEWTIEALNAATWRLGRQDLSALEVRISKAWLEIETNARPTVTITGPSETRSVTDGATTNASTTLTSATAAFTANDVGAEISGAGIPAGTTISSVTNATTAVLSAAATVTATLVTVTVVRRVITTTTRPLLSLVYADTEGDPKDAHRCRVFTAAQAAALDFDVESTVPVAATPGTANWVTGAGLRWQMSDLPNGDYVVYAQVRQQWTGVGTHPSLWVSYAFTVNVPSPDAPLMTAVSTPTGNILIDLSPGGDADPLPVTYSLYYSDDGGLSWALTWDGFQIPVQPDGTAATVDYLAPLYEGRLYKAIAYAPVSGVLMASPPTISDAPVVPTGDGHWLKDPFASALNTRILILEDEQSQSRQQGKFYPLSDDLDNPAFVIVVNGPLGGIEGQFVLGFKGPDELSGWQRFGAIFKPGRTLLLQFSTGEQHWVRLGKDIKRQWRPRGTETWWRKATLDYYEVEAPINPAHPGATTT